MDKFRTKIEEWDIFVIITLLCLIGLISLHSASYTIKGLLNKDFAKSQFMWVLFSLLVVFFVLKYGYLKLLDKAYILFAVNIILLLLIFAVGKTRLGARRWLNMGFFFLQPSELFKITFILALSRYIADREDKINNIFVFIIPLIAMLVPMILIIKQPDLGTALTLLPIFFTVLFASGIKKRFLFTPFIGAIFASPFLWGMLRPYQKNRVFVFLNPNTDPLGAGYTVIQSKIAIGSGGLFGKGWMAGTQNKLNFLPERHTDFIFSVIGEEWGFLGAAVVVVLFLILFSRLLRIAETTSDTAGRLLVTGVVSLLCFHVIVNIAMVMGLMPAVGIPLPFLSYGGSNLVTVMFLISMCESVRQRWKEF